MGGDKAQEQALLESKLSMAVRLYDPDAMLSISPAVANGMVLLLGDYSKQDEAGEQAVHLGFLALTEGNVVDAVFGTNFRNKNSPSYRYASIAKQNLGEAAMSSEGVPRLACEAYGEAFQHLLEYHKQMAQLNFVTACWKTARIRQDALQNIANAFRPLSEAIMAAN